jgi:hypothetical protein
LILASFDVHVQLSLCVSSGDLLEQGLLMRWVRLLLLVGKKGQLVLTALHNVEINERNQEMLSIFLIMQH